MKSEDENISSFHWFHVYNNVILTGPACLNKETRSSPIFLIHNSVQSLFESTQTGLKEKLLSVTNQWGKAPDKPHFNSVLKGNFKQRLIIQAGIDF